ncbi:hypothetical protein DPX39_110141600 [Trypanosoma brucei equiperdum]|uniref:Uncharacterized protein n=1 Tax=Trypanosoma brucei equiperdum TaxID=630700 RepID=A0A3L6KW64_9TRYP|nr:hypothetical protein DPX39_110141600 [Trypanosoma brucei equiperdum]
MNYSTGYSAAHSLGSTESLPAPGPVLHALLNNFEFFLLVLFAVLCQFIVFAVLGHTGGEVPGTLFFPFPLMRPIVDSIVTPMGRVLGRQQQVWVGVDYEDDAVDYDSLHGTGHWTGESST